MNSSLEISNPRNQKVHLSQVSLKFLGKVPEIDPAVISFYQYLRVRKNEILWRQKPELLMPKLGMLFGRRKKYRYPLFDVSASGYA
jgi:hypothetical protein